MLVKCCTQYASQFGKLCMVIGLEKVDCHSNPKERQCQRMFKLLHNCTHLTCYQSKAQNSPSQSSTVCKPRTSRCSSWILEKAEEPKIKLPTSIQFSSVAQSQTATSQTSLSITSSQCSFKLMSINLVMSSNHLILSHHLLLPPSIFISIRIFSNESVFHIR